MNAEPTQAAKPRDRILREIAKIKASPVPLVEGYNTAADNSQRRSDARWELLKAFTWGMIWVPSFAWHMKQYHQLSELDAYEAMQKDSRNPVLYLRGFHVDGEKSGNLVQWVNAFTSGALQRMEIEQFISTALFSFIGIIGWTWTRYGPFIGIGKPHERAPRIGAARFYVSDEHWQRVIIDAIERSQMVIMRLGASSAVFWELKVLFAIFPKERIVLRFDDSAAYERTRDYLVSEYGMNMPKKLGWSNVMRFDSQGNGIFSWSLNFSLFLSGSPMLSQLQNAFWHIPAYWSQKTWAKIVEPQTVEPQTGNERNAAA